MEKKQAIPFITIVDSPNDKTQATFAMSK